MPKRSFLKNFGGDNASGKSVKALLGLPDEGVAKSLADQSDQAQKAVDIIRPTTLRTPVIFASPHSGRRYPLDLLEQTKLDKQTLRLSEDSYVDLLIESAPQFGAPILRAMFPRAYVDVNRSIKELDPAMFQGNLPFVADKKSNRVLAGLGVVPRIVADGQNIYARKLPAGEAMKRLATCYEPYHAALVQLIQEAKNAFGVAVVIDCHSMPSAGGVPLRSGEPSIDFVLGDRFGVSSAPSLPGLIETMLRRNGHHVVRNVPYAGGYVANAYGRPTQGVHVLQIEINRGLYLDETRITRTSGFDGLRDLFKELIEELTEIDPGALRPARAAE